VLKFSKTGQFLLQIGQPGKMEGPDSQTTLNRPKAVAIDAAANEVYVADSGNHRIVVFDADTGAYKRSWGAYGEKPSAAAPPAYDPNAPAARQFRDVNCVHIAKDGMVYVCDSPSNRVQVFQKDGKYVKEGTVSKGTLGEVIPPGAGASIATESFGSAWDVAFSNDPQQRFLYVADGQNKTVWVLQRDSLSVVSRFGDGGRYPGRFYAVDSIAVDSKGNVYTGEGSEGKRVQKWLYKGMGAAQPLN
jgi:DNA-binding beta-propeller fold protein YncE